MVNVLVIGAAGTALPSILAWTPLTLGGGIGRIGSVTAVACLERGHTVTAYMRTPSKLEPSLREKVRVIQGNAKNREALRKAMEGTLPAPFLLESSQIIFRRPGRGDSSGSLWIEHAMGNV